MSNQNPALEISRSVKALREALGYSLQDVADKAGLSKSCVWEVESGESPNPSVYTLVSLSSALGCTLGDLIGLKSSNEEAALLLLLGQAYDDAARYGLPAHNRALWEKIWVTCAQPDSPPPEQTAAEAFSAWITQGPKLAAAAGCHVGIKVTEAKAALSGRGS